MKFFVKHLNSVNSIIHETKLRIYITQKDEVGENRLWYRQFKNFNRILYEEKKTVLKKNEYVRMFNLQRFVILLFI